MKINKSIFNLELNIITVVVENLIDKQQNPYIINILKETSK